MKITATMSSIDLVETINSIQPEGKAELRHDHFMVKIEKHPGITSPKFLGYVEIDIGNGATLSGFLVQAARVAMEYAKPNE